MPDATARTWAGRLGWLAAGALGHAAFASSSLGIPDVDSAVPHAADPTCPPAVAPDCPEPVVPVAGAPEVAVPDPVEPAPDPAPEPSRARPPKPSLTLPRMPGTNQLRAGTKWDETREAWALTFAYEIPAARAQVSTFYRKVLEDAGLQVSSTVGAPDSEGAVPTYLKGRSSSEHAHITVRQSVAEFETRVRVIWRFYAGGKE